MEQWEIDLRAKLEKEVPDGLYQLGDGSNGFMAYTGKGGKINFEVEFIKAAKNFIKNNTMELKENDSVQCINVSPLGSNSIAPDLELNKDYPIKEVFKCKCGEQHLNVGLVLNINWVECYKCRETLPPTNHWCNSIRFIKK